MLCRQFLDMVDRGILQATRAELGAAIGHYWACAACQQYIDNAAGSSQLAPEEITRAFAIGWELANDPEARPVGLAEKMKEAR